MYFNPYIIMTLKIVIQTLYIFLHWLLSSTSETIFFVSVFPAEGYVSQFPKMDTNTKKPKSTHSICRKNEL